MNEEVVLADIREFEIMQAWFTRFIRENNITDEQLAEGVKVKVPAKNSAGDETELEFTLTRVRVGWPDEDSR